MGCKGAAVQQLLPGADPDNVEVVTEAIREVRPHARRRRRRAPGRRDHLRHRLHATDPAITGLIRVSGRSLPRSGSHCAHRAPWCPVPEPVHPASTEHWTRHTPVLMIEPGGYLLGALAYPRRAGGGAGAVDPGPGARRRRIDARMAGTVDARRPSQLVPRRHRAQLDLRAGFATSYRRTCAAGRRPQSSRCGRRPGRGSLA
jgi:hypothetical protein